MTTLIRVPDQFTPGAGATATAATPTCCCCCCCVTSVVTTSAWLAEGLNADLRRAGRRAPTAVVLVMLGPLIAVAPLLVALLDDAAVGRFVGDHLVGVELVALLVAGLWTLAIPIASGAARPFAGLLRLAAGTVLWVAEFVLALFTVMTVEVAGLLLLPLILISLSGCYRRAHRG
ncbi:hypothetical protein [Actinophytocola sp. KF-1]